VVAQVTVMKTSLDEEWALIKPHVFATIMDYIQEGKPVLTDEALAAGGATTDTSFFLLFSWKS
jgi:hypothetical protein